MLGEIDTRDARESAISRVLKRRGAGTSSCDRTIIHSPRSREVSFSSDIRGLTKSLNGLQLCFNSFLFVNLTRGRALFESDLVLLNSYLDEHFLSSGEPGSPSLVGRRIAKPDCWLQRSDGP